MKKVSVIGAGAAGLVAAICAARAGASVELLEAGERVGASILATGNGRCNLTNANVCSGVYNCPEFVAPVLDGFGAREALEFFSGIGLLCREEREGRVYPMSNSATTVVDALRFAAEREGVRVRCGVCVADVAEVEADAVVVACGGGSQLLKTAGHRLVSAQPVLCALATNPEPLRGLENIRAHAQVTLTRDGAVVAQEAGEVQFRSFGVSGIVIFNLSRHAQPGDELTLDFTPELTSEVLASHLAQHGSFSGLFHSRLAQAIQRAGNNPKQFTLRVQGPANTKHAQVTRGGAATEEFNPRTLESQIRPGLYACGETLNVDGPCGGYNLHWAWASGAAAGYNCAQVK